jgi:phosphoglycerate dehydrogenase-like enzyme
MIIVVEDNNVLRLLEVLFEAQLPGERLAALDDYFAHDSVDLLLWRDSVRLRAPGLFPSTLKFVSEQHELRSSLRDADAVVVEGLEIGDVELGAAKSLKVVCKFGTVTDNINLAACEHRGVRVETVRRRTNIAVAEHSLALMLALIKKITTLNGCVTVERINAPGRSYRPYDTRHVGHNNYARQGGLRNLAGLTVGILGMGEIGREVALRARAFGLRVIYHQRRRLSPADESALAASYCALPELFSAANIVTLHLPLTRETRGLIGGELLGCMKPGSFLINTSRAQIIDRRALIDALKSGGLDGAALDVQYDEPVRSDDPLLGFENVLLTPHVAGGSRTNLTEDVEEVVLKVRDGLDKSDRDRDRNG